MGGGVQGLGFGVLESNVRSPRSKVREITNDEFRMANWGQANQERAESEFGACILFLPLKDGISLRTLGDGEPGKSFRRLSLKAPAEIAPGSPNSNR